MAYPQPTEVSPWYLRNITQALELNEATGQVFVRTNAVLVGNISVGNVAIGCEADFVIINPQAKPLLARKWQQAQSLEEALFALIVLGDDRTLECVHVAQK